ncbi:kinase-like domain-containing protein [Rhexocercosporidium sp. MPI-PUGE-AT-0058]|nr:kinase-like domain-containing protein [Rhexocercosporidium sp. MPI-PUGE-AT-0058]
MTSRSTAMESASYVAGSVEGDSLDHDTQTSQVDRSQHWNQHSATEVSTKLEMSRRRIGVSNDSADSAPSLGKEPAQSTQDEALATDVQSTIAPNQDSEGESESSKVIVCYQKKEGKCNPHSFKKSDQSTENYIGKGTFGEVFKADCRACHRDFACKIIRFNPSFNKAARAKQIRATDMELRCYMTLNHPNILEYVHHELRDSKMEIYTEFCEAGDLQCLLDEQQPDAGLDELCWEILEALASALSRCHSGLNANRRDGGVLCEYLGFEEGWNTILHRDIKPANGNV